MGQETSGSNKIPEDAPNAREQDRANRHQTPQQGLLVDSLANLPSKTLLDEAMLAHALRVTPRTIRRMVSRFELPPPVSLGGRSVWFVGRVLSHIESAMDRASREAQRQARRIRDLSC